MTKIVSIHSGVNLTAPREVNPDVLAAAEEFLALVRDGMITGFVLMSQRADGIYRAYEEGPFDIEPMIGHLHRTIHRLVSISEEQDAPDR